MFLLFFFSFYFLKIYVLFLCELRVCFFSFLIFYLLFLFIIFILFVDYVFGYVFRYFLVICFCLPQFYSCSSVLFFACVCLVVTSLLLEEVRNLGVRFFLLLYVSVRSSASYWVCRLLWPYLRWFCLPVLGLIFLVLYLFSCQRFHNSLSWGQNVVISGIFDLSFVYICIQYFYEFFRFSKQLVY